MSLDSISFFDDPGRVLWLVLSFFRGELSTNVGSGDSWVSVKSTISSGDTGIFFNPNVLSGVLYYLTRPPWLVLTSIFSLLTPGDELQDDRPILCVFAMMSRLFTLLVSVLPLLRGFFTAFFSLVETGSNRGNELD